MRDELDLKSTHPFVLLNFSFVLLALLTTTIACHPQSKIQNPKSKIENAAPQDWEAAIPDLKARLRADPHDIAAHFYLGRCYLLSKDAFPGAAEGEFCLALDLFAAHGRKSPIPEFSDDYFELRCRLEIAKVHLQTFLGALATKQPFPTLRRVLDRCERATQEAERLAPNSPDVRQLRQHVNDLRHTYFGTTPTNPV